MRMRGAAALALLALTLSALPAEAAPRAWQRAETAHFIVVFEQEDRSAADQVLTFCEEVYGQVTAFFGSPPARKAKIPCVIHGSMDYANGSTTPFPGRIDLSLTAPSDHSMGARSESWLRIVFTHELAHFVHLGMDRGPFAALSRVFGSDVAMGSAIFLPGWMVEGATVNLETILTAGGRGRSPLFEIYSKAPVMEGDLFSLRQAGYDSSFPPPGRIYVAGHILVDHILTEFGADAFARIMDAYLAFPFFGPWAAIEKVTGKKAAAVYAEMKESLAGRYAPSAALAAGTRLTADAMADYRRPQATGRGLYLYRTSPDQVPAIVRLDPVTGEEEELARVALTDASSFSATADGETVYFASLAWDWRRPGMGEAVSDLYRLAVRTGKITRVTRGAHLWQPAVSADGLRLAAVQADGPYSSLVSVDPASGRVTELYARQGTNVFTPSFSPGGLSLAFTLNERGFQDICLLPLTGADAGKTRLLTGPDRNGEYYPAFLDEGRVIFSSDRTGSLCLYTVDTRSGDLAMVLEEPVAAISGIRDGSSLVYESYRSRGFCLRQVPLADLDTRAVDRPCRLPRRPLGGGRDPTSARMDRHDSRVEAVPRHRAAVRLVPVGPFHHLVGGLAGRGGRRAGAGRLAPGHLRVVTRPGVAPAQLPAPGRARSLLGAGKPPARWQRRHGLRGRGHRQRGGLRPAAADPSPRVAALPGREHRRVRARGPRLRGEPAGILPLRLRARTVVPGGQLEQVAEGCPRHQRALAGLARRARPVPDP